MTNNSLYNSILKQELIFACKIDRPYLLNSHHIFLLQLNIGCQLDCTWKETNAPFFSQHPHYTDIMSGNLV